MDGELRKDSFTVVGRSRPHGWGVKKMGAPQSLAYPTEDDVGGRSLWRISQYILKRVYLERGLPIKVYLTPLQQSTSRYASASRRTSQCHRHHNRHRAVVPRSMITKLIM